MASSEQVMQCDMEVEDQEIPAGSSECILESVEEKCFQCEACDKSFSQMSTLTCHMKLHTPHVCQFCGKNFNSKVGKEIHECIHTGGRPYKCCECGMGFTCSANLRQHSLIHSDFRPLSCEVCQKLFRRCEDLQVHMRTHTGELPYYCPICGRRYKLKEDMLKHSESHPNVLSEDILLSATASSACHSQVSDIKKEAEAYLREMMAENALLRESTFKVRAMKTKSDPSSLPGSKKEKHTLKSGAKVTGMKNKKESLAKDYFSFEGKSCVVGLDGNIIHFNFFPENDNDQPHSSANLPEWNGRFLPVTMHNRGRKV